MKVISKVDKGVDNVGLVLGKVPQGSSKAIGIVSKGVDYYF